MHTEIDELIDSIRLGQLAIVVGSGVSRYANPTDPKLSWPGLIADGLDLVERTTAPADLDPFRMAIATFRTARTPSVPQLLDAADTIEALLGAPEGPRYEAWLRETLGCANPIDRKLIELIGQFPGHLVTLNYDQLLEQVIGQSGVSWSEPSDIIAWARTASRSVLHAHGLWNDPTSVIFGRASYSRVTADETIQQVLRGIAVANTLLFIGCGDTFSDPNIGQFMSWGGRLLSRSKFHHFKLAVGTVGEVIEYDEPSRLYTIGYGGSYDDLPPFLNFLLVAGGVRKDIVGSTLGLATYSPTANFVGRKSEVGKLRRILTAERAFVPVLGGPGVGKTHLVIRALDHDTVRRRHRVVMVHCDGTARMTDLLQRIGKELSSSGLSTSVQIADSLSRLPTILFLDNLEVLPVTDPGGLGDFFKLLALRDLVSVVASFRGQQFPVRLLAWSPPVMLAPLRKATAKSLFVSVAGRRFANDPALDSMLDITGRLPALVQSFAIEARKEPDLTELVARYRLEVSAASARGTEAFLPSNVVASFDRAYSSAALSDDDRDVLGVLALFPLGLQRQALAKSLGITASHALRNLRASALVFDIAASRRVVMLPPFRDFVRSKTAPPEHLVRAVTTYFLEICNTNGRRVGQLQGADAAGGLLDVLEELEFSLRMHVQFDSVRVRKAALAFANFMDFTGYGSTDVLEQVIAAISADEDTAALSERLGDVYYFRSQLTRAQTAFLRAQKKYLPGSSGFAKCLKRRGEITAALGDLPEARVLVEAARETYRAASDSDGEARCLRALGTFHLFGLNLDRAERLAGDASHIFLRLEDPLGLGNCENTLGFVDLARGNAPAARLRFQRAQELLAGIGDPNGYGSSLLGLGECAMGNGDFSSAQDHFQFARSAFRTVGRHAEEAVAIYWLRRVRGELGLRMAATEMTFALEQARRVESAEGRGFVHALHSLDALNEDERIGHRALAARLWARIGRWDLCLRLLGPGFTEVAFGSREGRIDHAQQHK